MSRFYTVVESDGRKAFRRSSGKEVDVEVRGWNVGVRVRIVNDGGEDRVDIWTTGGTNDRNNHLLRTLRAPTQLHLQT